MNQPLQIEPIKNFVIVIDTIKGVTRPCNFKSALQFALNQFWNYFHDYSLNCTLLGPATILIADKLIMQLPVVAG